jgi:TolB protein
MTKKPLLLIFAAAGIALLSQAQDVVLKIVGGAKPAIAVADFRGAGEAAPFMAVFNKTLYGDLGDSGLFEMTPKSLFPIEVPQQPSDFQPPAAPPAPVRGRPSPPAAKKGPWLTDWSEPPPDAKYLAFGYAAAQNGQFVLAGWLFDVEQPNLAGAQLIGKRYFGPLSDIGARQVAHEFAAEIIAKFGGESLLGSRIYFVSDRTGHKEIWSMDADGANQKQITRYRSISFTPSVSPDGKKLAFTSFAKGDPGIFVFSLETERQLLFYNQRAPTNATPNFTPDGQRILYASSASGFLNIYMADVDGGNLQRISTSRRIEVEPKANPKTGRDIVFVSGRSGPQQIWKMSLDGTNAEMLTSGEGDASNPAWHPNGEIIAFSWTRGLEPGNFNIFLMDVASRHIDQLTHGKGRNENPNWAPDGRHLVFASNRNGSMQIFSMLADGTHVVQLTTQGRNQMPVWGK